MSRLLYREGDPPLQHSETVSGLYIPEDKEADLVEKKYDIGEVIAVGSECKEIKLGDIVLYQRNAAMRIPNGIDAPFMYKLEETPIAIVAVLDKQPEDVVKAAWEGAK
jgi:co-chaperonin GroES (HSP10)